MSHLVMFATERDKDEIHLIDLVLTLRLNSIKKSLLFVQTIVVLILRNILYVNKAKEDAFYQSTMQW